ncbi:MAG: 4-hydroxy-tetrahydrodipicolinate reductase [Myxococcota bacterium]
MATQQTQQLSPVPLIVCGAHGNMGQAVLQAAQGIETIEIVAGVVAPRSPQTGKQAQQHWPWCRQNFTVHNALDQALQQSRPAAAVVLDFSVAAACEKHVQLCQQHRVAYVTGVTGLQQPQQQALQQAAQTIAVLHAANMSLGVNVLQLLCCLAAQLLPDADIEIAELHHRCKHDHPSGTALWLAHKMAASRQWPSDCVCTQQRQGVRKRQEIGIASLRGGDERGSHMVHMLLQDESIQLTHRAASRAVYAQGALLACQYVVNQTAGQYHMHDVLKPFLRNNLQHLLDSI